MGRLEMDAFFFKFGGYGPSTLSVFLFASVASSFTVRMSNFSAEKILKCFTWPAMTAVVIFSS